MFLSGAPIDFSSETTCVVVLNNFTYLGVVTVKHRIGISNHFEKICASNCAHYFSQLFLPTYTLSNMVTSSNNVQRKIQGEIHFFSRILPFFLENPPIFSRESSLKLELECSKGQREGPRKALFRKARRLFLSIKKQEA